MRLCGLLVPLLLAVAVVGELSELERIYYSLPSNTTAREHLAYYTSLPHIAGSPGDYETAVYTQQKFTSYGWDAKIVEEQIYINYPLNREVKLLNESGNVIFRAGLTEPAVAVDPTSSNPNIVPTFNGYSAAGNVTAKLVYANYGTLQDFQYLASNNVSVAGHIVIVRYGAIFRGVKAYLAEKYGAVGLLIYSDPKDNGYVRGETYPDGPWSPEYGVQRGSVQYLPICPGSPASPGRVAACLGDEFAGEGFEGNLIPSIPVQPLSWGDAWALLNGLTGLASPDAWKGALNVSYNIGPGGSIVNLDLQMNYTTVTIWNVVATLSGETSDEVVLFGNHRDAWVFGATDPSSGSSVMLEVARSLGILKSLEGWVPKRDIMFLSWDAEEYGLEGSTAWGEANADWLRDHAVAYINIDVGVGGPNFQSGGTPSLNDFLQAVASDIPSVADPNVSVGQKFNQSQISVLGSGSDYTVFSTHLGIPVLEMEYGGAISGGVYHSIYDSLYWMDHFGDPEYLYHKNLAQLAGVAVIRLADSNAPPFNYTNYAGQLSLYLAAEQIANATGKLDFTPLEDAITEFTDAGIMIDSQTTCANNIYCTPFKPVIGLNTRIRASEQRFLINAHTNATVGLPGRPWYRHVLQAPGLYLGYGAQTFPGIDQGISDANWTLAQQQIIVAANAIQDTAMALREISFQANATPALCYGDATGILHLIPTGGFTPLQYSVNSTYQLNPIFGGLVASIYEVIMRDAQNFTTRKLIAIPQPDKLVATIRVNGSSATVSAVGGTGNYTYKWANGDDVDTVGVNHDEKYTVTVTVTDANGCSVETTFSNDPASKKLSGGSIAGIVFAVLMITAIGGGAVWYYIKQRKERRYEVL